MKKIFTKRTISYLMSALFLVINYGCQPDDGNLEEATFPTIADVFIDTFSAGLQYDAFGDSRVTAFAVDTDVVFQGSAAMRFDIPNTNDPQGGYAGGIFSVEGGRNLTSYNVLTFYARASRGETINEIGFGLTFGGEVYRTQVNNLQVGTEWQKYFIPIPDAAKLTQESGMLWYAEAADNGESYQLWLDEVKYENLNTVLLESATILNGVDQVTAASAGNTITIDGTSATYNLPTGTLQTVTTTPAFFDYTSSNESVATVNEFGVVLVLSNEGSSIISATLDGQEADGSITFMDVDASGNVDDSDATEVALPLGFESTILNYNPIGFEGAVPSIGANPVVGGLNNSSNVLRSLKSEGSVFFAGQFIDLDVPVDFSTDQIVSALVLSPNAGTPVRIAFENSGDPGTQIRVDVSTTVSNQWEELIFDFSGLINTGVAYDRMVVIFDIDEANPTAGDGSVYYIDDIQLTDGSGGGGNMGGDNLLENGDFEQGMTVWEGNGFNVQTDGGNSFNFVDVATAGNPFDVNLSQRGLAITEGDTYTLTFDASTDAATGTRTMLAGIGLFVAPFTNAVSEINITDTTQTFTVELTANFSSSDGRVLFDMGADTGVIVIDNVSLVVSDGGNSGGDFLSNGDFEEGMTVWEGNGFNVQTDGGNSFNFVDVATAGNPFDVNLSQRGLAITEGQSFTLTFDASTDAATGSRTMIVGIGLFVAPFTNQSMEVTLTDATQTFNVELIANFSSTDGRVLFDMGADTGVVVIDNVTLTLN
ncbi:carbohydrate binding domain-containing protein [uncultured Dokdonia sp.]|uniref:carbohydrate binding domain-containing protein n=1 Tax=uncultured Dokdonia sp. TaxID=575653 RepID=UPI00262CA4D7|nr:carbohydrate binding domain-containing protein [uncultured Dokdonia sp.]